MDGTSPPKFFPGWDASPPSPPPRFRRQWWLPISYMQSTRIAWIRRFGGMSAVLPRRWIELSPAACCWVPAGSVSRGTGDHMYRQVTDTLPQTFLLLGPVSCKNGTKSAWEALHAMPKAWKRRESVVCSGSKCCEDWWLSVWFKGIIRASKL